MGDGPRKQRAVILRHLPAEESQISRHLRSGLFIHHKVLSIDGQSRPQIYPTNIIEAAWKENQRVMISRAPSVFGIKSRGPFVRQSRIWSDSLLFSTHTSHPARIDMAAHNNEKSQHSEMTADDQDVNAVHLEGRAAKEPRTLEESNDDGDGSCPSESDTVPRKTWAVVVVSRASHQTSISSPYTNMGLGVGCVSADLSFISSKT